MPDVRFSWQGRGAAFLLVLAGLLTACLEQEPARERTRHLAVAEQITLGLAWPLDHPKRTLVEGAELAVGEINADGGVLGRPLTLQLRDDERSVDEAMRIAESFAADPRLSAVIAHLDSSLALAAAPAYEQAELPMLTPGATDVHLTERGYQWVFRTMVNNAHSGRQLADRLVSQGHERVVVYYLNNPFGRDLARQFESRAAERGLEVVDRRGYDGVGSNHARRFRDWRDFLAFDAIVIAGSLPEGAAIIRQIRALGVDVPIHGGIGLDSPALVRLGGDAVGGVQVTTVFHPDMPGERVAEFVAAYEEKTGQRPDAAAAQGYDAVYLLAAAMERAESVQPAAIAKALRAPMGYSGVSGLYRFDPHGELIDKPVIFQQVAEGSLQYLTH
ncbi:ABC transporter substrate-binding protein [Spiribacter aquaticus]|uniref:ABC transporter substrate-binding protein n=1 Tax=Spiribacter aquaticus TaxID=1935996 RepID=A0A557RJK2_9GAMM|nr:MULTISPECIES: ABC transporter substrate-binding protein [Spiribacter]KAF0280141.1 hypothetical protein BA897_05345 [Spiribacter roseus]TVO65330.1 ABC transporter substrate-binding protein [Spiribacter aquaticus]